MNEAFAKGMTYVGAGGALIFGYDANTVAALGGLLIGALGLLLTWHYQRKRDRREQEAHERRMRNEG